MAVGAEGEEGQEEGRGEEKLNGKSKCSNYCSSRVRCGDGAAAAAADDRKGGKADFKPEGCLRQDLPSELVLMD